MISDTKSIQSRQSVRLDRKDVLIFNYMNCYSCNDFETQVRLDGDYVELEMDALNSHECMAPLVALLKHIHKNNIFPAAQSVSSLSL